MHACCLLLAFLPAAAPPCRAGDVVARLRAAGRIDALAFSPDGKRLVGVGAAGVTWDVIDGLVLKQTKASGTAKHLTFDGTTARWVSSRTLWAWDVAKEEKAAAMTSPRSKLSAEYPQATSPDGKTLAVVTPTDRRFRLVSLTQDRADRVLTNLSAGYGHRVVFSPDGRVVALCDADKKSVTIFDVATGEQVRRLIPHDNRGGASPVAFAPDGRSLVRFDRDTRLIETTTGGERARLSRLGSSEPVAWSRDGRLLARAIDARVVVTDTFTGKDLLDLQTPHKQLTALAFSPDCTRLATADEAVIVWRMPAVARLSPELPTTSAWRDLADSGAAVGHKAIRSLVADGDDAARWLGERLKSRPVPDAKEIARLIKELDEDDFDVREKASDELTQIGSPARAAIEAAAKNPPSPEVKRRCAALLAKLGGGSVPPSELRGARAVEVLEKIGSAEAKKVLERLLEGKPAAPLAAEIRATLARMGERR